MDLFVWERQTAAPIKDTELQTNKHKNLVLIGEGNLNSHEYWFFLVFALILRILFCFSVEICYEIT